MKHSLFLATILAAAVATSCGGDAKDFAKFEGTWTYDSGSIVGTCPGMMPAMSDLTGDMITISRGTSSDLLLVVTPDCQIKFNISGDKASATPGQICMLAVMGVGSLAVSVDSWTLETPDGAKMTAAMAGKVTVPIPNGGGLSFTCNVTGDGMLTKQP